MEQNTFSAISKRQTLIVVNILILNVDFVIKIPVFIFKGKHSGTRNTQQIWLFYPD